MQIGAETKLETKLSAQSIRKIHIGRKRVLSSQKFPIKFHDEFYKIVGFQDLSVNKKRLCESIFGF